MILSNARVRAPRASTTMLSNVGARCSCPSPALARVPEFVVDFDFDVYVDFDFDVDLDLAIGGGPRWARYEKSCFLYIKIPHFRLSEARLLRRAEFGSPTKNDFFHALPL